MHRHKIFSALAALVLALADTGCRKPELPPPAPVAVSPDAVARVHWLGKKRLGIEASAYFFNRIWDLPESARLQAQIFDKLATAPWRLLFGDAAAAQIPPTVLRPLLDDLAQEEFYLEARAPTNQPGELAFAIHLNPAHAGVWETNGAIASELLAGNLAVADKSGHGWTITCTNAPNFIRLTRVGEWTVIGAGTKKNPLLGEINARIARDSAPLPPSPTNFWLEADVDLSRTAQAFSLPSSVFNPQSSPRVALTVTGDGGNVIVRGELNFPQPLPLALEPWAMPTRLLHEPLASFSAARGFAPWLAAQKSWTSLAVGLPPNQIYFWALDGSPVQTYFAAPLSDASNRVGQISQRLMEQGNPWLAARGYVGFEHLPDASGIVWGSQTNLLPFLKAVDDAPGGVVFGGLLPDAGDAANLPPPAGMIQDILGRTNLVYYDWEVTGPRLDSWFYLGQTAREILRRPKLPPDSASMNWLLPLRPRLGTSATIVTLTKPNQLTLLRKSTVGLTAVELQLLADWLESPQFPGGLHTSVAPVDK